MKTQTLTRRYVNRQALYQFLNDTFGSNGYQVEERSSSYILTIPRFLTEVSGLINLTRTPVGRERGISTLKRNQKEILSRDIAATLQLPCISSSVARKLPEMNVLSAGLVAIRRENHHGDWYLPWSNLNLLFDESNIQRAVKESNIEPYQRDEAVRIILHGAKRTFATMVIMNRTSSFMKFVERDHLQNQSLDARLPYTKPELLTILGETEGALFYRNQWMVSAPFFLADSNHRAFERDTVLPFVTDEKIDEGAYGDVYATKIDSEHQSNVAGQNTSTSLDVVRKCMDISLLRKDNLEMLKHSQVWENESHVLSLVRLIKHSCMVKLISSYTFRGTYNLLFERAEGNLESFLYKSNRPSALLSDNAIFQALQGLCSAVAAFHLFVHPEMELSLKGYHHDLKPENILVSGSRFLLADFGLSKLKNVNSKSKTLSKDIRGYYLSPESGTIQDGFEKKLVGQSSDIWALGCILCVVLTYILKGPNGVQEFEERRRFKSGPQTTFTFHWDGSPSPEVENWLMDLETDGAIEVRNLVTLIRHMLRIVPSERPSAGTVSSRMDFLALQSIYNLIMSRFAGIKTIPESFLIELEHTRMKLFGQALEICQLGKAWQCVEGIITANTTFESLRDYMDSLEQDLKSFVEYSSPTIYPTVLVRQIRSQVDRLWNCLHFSVRERQMMSLEAQIVSTKDYVSLENTQRVLQKDLIYENIGLSAAIRSMIIRANLKQIDSSGMRCDFGCFQEKLPYITPFSSLGHLAIAGGQAQRAVLVEWLEYNEHWQGSRGQELASRIESVAHILHQKQYCERLRALHCIKYFHDSSRNSYGLAFEVPMTVSEILSSSYEQGATSLQRLIATTRKIQRPDVGDLFRLAKSLAASVLEWHKIGWIHRGVSAYSIVFFGIDPNSSLHGIMSPFFLGFQFSRPNDANAITIGPTDILELMDYCHPEYLQFPTRYRPEFDYYSLGLVLLEIGYWKPLKELTKGCKDPSPARLRDWILDTSVKDLHMLMGSVYQNAVRKCLSFGSTPNLESNDVVSLDVLEEFRENVLNQIQLCNA